MTNFKAISIRLGFMIGIGLSVLLGLLYVVVFHETSSAFYGFAFLCLIVCPCISGILATWWAQEHKPAAFLISGGSVLGVVVILWLLYYVILPVLAPFESAQIPETCIQDAAQLQSNLPADQNYAIPGVGTGTLLTSDANAAVVVKPDDSQPSFPSAIFLINRKTDQVVGNWQFGSDAVAAALDGGVLYLFYDNLGSFVDENSGDPVKYIVKADNYRQLYNSGDAQYMQTSMIFSALHRDGTVTSHLRVTFRTMAYGCILS